MLPPSGLTTRQYARNRIDWRAEFVICESHREQVRYSPMSNANSPHIARGITIDISSGGMGMICQQYVPRMTEGKVRIFDPNSPNESDDDEQTAKVIFEHRVKVQRVELASHDPSYALGIGFIDPEPGIDERVAKLLGQFNTGNLEGDDGG